MRSSQRRLTRNDYTVGWISALPLEMAAAMDILYDSHTPLPQPRSDHNSYHLGEIGDHNVVIACLPTGVYETTSAAVVAKQMLLTFPSIKVGLMVGIGEEHREMGSIFVWVVLSSACQPIGFQGWHNMIMGRQWRRDYFIALAH